MQPEMDESSWTFYNPIDSSLDQIGFYGVGLGYSGDDLCEIPTTLTKQDDIYDFETNPFFSDMFSDGLARSPSCNDNVWIPFPAQDYALDHEIESYFSEPVEIVQGRSSSGSEGQDLWSPSSSIKSNEASVVLTPSSLVLPCAGFELDNQISILHLLKAYGEALEDGQRELADIIIRRVSEKASPAGATLERLAFNLSQDLGKQADYLKQESSKNFETAFQTFYQIFPYGRFAHFAANSAILEAMPVDAETIHIVDFDMGEGIQWPPMIEALSRKQKAVRLTSVKIGKELECEWTPLMWSFEEAQRRLHDHARHYGVKLKVEEMELQEMVTEIKKEIKKDGKNEWLTFNCMVGLPHMGRVRNGMLVKQFLRIAKELTGAGFASDNTNRGIITFATGHVMKNLRDGSGFGSFMEASMAHYRALLESIESNFRASLEARMMLECLFVAPYISSRSWSQKWDEVKEDWQFHVADGLGTWRVSKERLEEAREMVKLNQNLYEVKLGGENQDNQIILEWKGTPLLRVSTWIN
ncbi:hypothetical protein K2173_008403 [Erythroxylum novogranatense]|uniref:Nodulation signaling pathway 2-like protein n=1 Tax=Erythroxylum novogranatense TaxID=1862640 RepID=A0AAV8U8Z3_9ROSI|nr:hypothetical protein K2173_008403 [Erythroxylum novogranatense]